MCHADANARYCCSLALPEQVEAMVNYIVDEPPEDASDKQKHVYPFKVSLRLLP